MTNKNIELAKNTAIIAAGKIATQFLSFFLTPLYTWFLAPDDFGTADLILSYVSIAAVCATLQIERGLFRHIVDVRGDKNKLDEIASSAIFAVLPVLMFAVAIFVPCAVIFGLPYWSAVLLNLIAMAANSIIMQFARGVGDNKNFSIGSVVASLTTTLAAVLFVAIFKMNAVAIFYASMLGNFACFAYLLIKLRIYRHIKISRATRKSAKELLRYSIPFVPNTIGLWLITASHRTIITVFVGTFANGLFAVSGKFSYVVASLSNVFEVSYAESATLHIEDKDKDVWFSKVFNQIGACGFGSIAIMIIAVLPLVFSSIIGGEYFEAYYFIPALIIGAYFNTFTSSFMGPIYIAKKQTKKIMSSTLLAAAISIGLSLATIPHIGIWGACISTTLAWIVVFIYRYFDVQKWVKIRLEREFWVILLVLTAVCLMYFSNNVWSHLVTLCLAAVACVWMNWGVVRRLPGLMGAVLKRQ